MKLINLIKKPWLHLSLLAILLLLIFSQSTLQLVDDGVYYQQFVETIVNEGLIDLSIPGFHGADFLALPIYLITGSQFAVYYLDIIFALALIPMIYFVFQEIFKNKLVGVVAAYIYTLMPLEVFNALRAGHQTIYLFFIFLTLYLLFKNSKWSWLSLGIAYTIKPFAIAITPFFIYKKKIKQFLLSLVIPIIYVLAQYGQTGKIMIGIHPDLTIEKLFSFKRFVLNIFYAFQNYFSIHNYSPFNPLYDIDLIHLSPLITVLAVIGLIYYQKYFLDKKLFYTIASFALISFLIPTSFYRMDMWYYGTFNWALVMLAILPLLGFRKLIPIVTFSFAYQFLYIYLAFRDLFWTNYIVFIIPLIIFLISLIYTFGQRYFKVNKISQDENINSNRRFPT